MATISYDSNRQDRAVGFFGKAADFIHVKNPSWIEPITQNYQRKLSAGISGLLAQTAEPVNIAIVRLRDTPSSESGLFERKDMVLAGAWVGNADLTGQHLAEVTPTLPMVTRMVQRWFVGADPINPKDPMNKILVELNKAAGQIYYTEAQKHSGSKAFDQARVFFGIQHVDGKPDATSDSGTVPRQKYTNVNVYYLALTKKELGEYILGTRTLSDSLPASMQTTPQRPKVTDYSSTYIKMPNIDKNNERGSAARKKDEGAALKLPLI